MKIQIYLMAFIFGMAFFTNACNNVQPVKDAEVNTANVVSSSPSEANVALTGKRVELVYFHTKESCHCMSVVKDNLKYALEKHFGRELASGRVKLTTIVSDDPANAELLKAYDAMLFFLYIKDIHDDREKIELVNEIWNMTGDDNKEKLAEFIRFKVAPLLAGENS